MNILTDLEVALKYLTQAAKDELENKPMAKRIMTLERAVKMADSTIARLGKEQAAPDMYAALVALTEHYTALINSGDAGNWNPEEEDEVILSRAALAKADGIKE